jgi:spoIIIJ-associated protein
MGDNLATLIGRRGETLASLEYLVKLVVSNKQNRWTNISLDIDGYKQRREHQLKRLAQRMANQVQQFGRPIALEPMPPNERRIVHITLEQNSGVTTNSTGDGNQRRVNIQPSLLR